MHETQELILRADAAFRRGDIEAVIENWHPEGVLKPLSADRSYRGHHELREFLEGAKHRAVDGALVLETVLQQDGVALIFGKYRIRKDEESRDHGAYWIAEVRDGKLLAWQGFRLVSTAFAAFSQRISSR